MDSKDTRENVVSQKSKRTFSLGICLTIAVITLALLFMFTKSQIIMAVLFPMLVFAFAPWVLQSDTNSQNHYQIDGEFLDIAVSKNKERLKISAMKVGIVKVTSEWEPINGKRYSGLYLGKCLLKNNKLALVSQRLGYSQYLVIEVENNHYLIGHPGVTVLYNDLLRLGAKEGKFKN